METIHFSKLGKEDIAFGSGAFEVQLSDGRRASLTKVNLSAFAPEDTTDKAIYFTSGSNVGQDSDFLYDTSTKQVTVGSSGSMRIGSSGTAGDDLHIAVDGAAAIRLDNTGTNTGDVGIKWYKNGSTAWIVTGKQSCQQ